MLPTGETMRTHSGSCWNRMLRRMVNLPLGIIGGMSRAMNHGILLASGGRRDHILHQTQQGNAGPPDRIPQEWVFLNDFEHRYGDRHPFFRACGFMDALKSAGEESKLLFVYLHSPQHPYTAPFCSNTLCSELVIQILDANFVCWGAAAEIGEGLQMCSTLRAEVFPFCAIVAPASDKSIEVLQQVEGPVSAGELVEILHSTMEERGSAFMTEAVNRQLREEQDHAYLASLLKDMEKDRTRDLVIEEVGQKPLEPQKMGNSGKIKNSSHTKQSNTKMKETANKPQHNENVIIHRKSPEITQIQIRFPNGERRTQSFSSTEKIQSIYKYIDSLDLPGIGSYRLISNFPRKVYGFEQLGMTLREAGLYPSASLFLELLYKN